MATAGVLLLGADYYGTLAAARCYGRHGIDVAMADENPRARGLYSRFVKEKLVHPPLSELERFRQLVPFAPVLTKRHADVAEPMVQEYLTAAETSIFSVSGFVDQKGTVVPRAAMKVLQRPRKVGIGLCFEGRAIEEELA